MFDTGGRCSRGHAPSGVDGDATPALSWFLDLLDFASGGDASAPPAADAPNHARARTRGAAQRLEYGSDMRKRIALSSCTA